MSDLNEGLLILRYTKESPVSQQVIDEIKKRCEETGIAYAETKFKGVY